MVERSTDGGKSFKQIGTVAYTGAENYIYTDAKAPAGLVIYRLAQNDGHTTAYSNEVEFTVAQSTTAQTLRVYPNPANSTMALTGKTALPNKIWLQISNTSGQIFDAGTDVSNINVSNLPPGVYVLIVKDAKTRKLYGTLKFIKI